MTLSGVKTGPMSLAVKGHESQVNSSIEQEPFIRACFVCLFLEEERGGDSDGKKGLELGGAWRRKAFRSSVLVKVGILCFGFDQEARREWITCRCHIRKNTSTSTEVKTKPWRRTTGHCKIRIDLLVVCTATIRKLFRRHCL